MIRFTNLPIPPSVNNLFPSGKGGRRFPSPEYQTWKIWAGKELQTKLIGREKEIHGPVALSYMYEEGATKADLGNLEKAVTDFLVAHRIIDGDGPKVVKSITLAWGSLPGLTIEVRRRDVIAKAALSQPEASK